MRQECLKHAKRQFSLQVVRSIKIVKTSPNSDFLSPLKTLEVLQESVMSQESLEPFLRIFTGSSCLKVFHSIFKCLLGTQLTSS